MDKQKLISFTKEEIAIISEYAKEHKLSEYNAVKEIVRIFGEQMK